MRREPGRGTFLVNPRLRSNTAYLHSFTEEIERWGYTPGAGLISREESEASEQVASRLEIESGEEVLFVRRLRLADELPIFVCDSYLPVGRFPAFKDADYGTVFPEQALSGEDRTRDSELEAVDRRGGRDVGRGCPPRDTARNPCPARTPHQLRRGWLSHRTWWRRTSTPNATSTTTN